MALYSKSSQTSLHNLSWSSISLCEPPHPPERSEMGEFSGKVSREERGPGRLFSLDTILTDR